VFPGCMLHMLQLQWSYSIVFFLVGAKLCWKKILLEKSSCSPGYLVHGQLAGNKIIIPVN
jgi:hypothetical protein